MHILAISLARQVFLVESRERIRMEACACAVDSLTMIVLTRRSHGLRERVHKGRFCAIPTNSKNRFSMLIDAYRIGKRILAERKDGVETVVSAQDPFEIGCVGFLLSRLPRTLFHVQVHGSFFDSPIWKKESPLNHIRYYLGMFLLRRALGIRVVSSRIARSLSLRGIDERRITILPIHIDIGLFLSRRQKKSKGEPRHRGMTLVYVGRFSREKNLPLLIRAMVFLHDSYRDVTLRLVGGGSEYERLVLLVEELAASAYIHFVPWTKDVELEMERSDIFVFPSNHEGYALVLIEAMASGLPIVTTDVGCVGEEVLPGVHALASPPGDEVAFRESLRILLENQELRRKLGDAGLRRAREMKERTGDSYVIRWRNSFECRRERL